MIFGIILGLALSLVSWVIISRKKHRHQGLSGISSRKTRFTDAAECTQILTINQIGGLEPENLLTPIESRAVPNQRLVRAFDIDNAFTTTDDTYRKEFRSSASGLLSKPKIEDWKRLATIADNLIHRGVENPKVILIFLSSPFLPFLENDVRRLRSYHETNTAPSISRRDHESRMY